MANLTFNTKEVRRIPINRNNLFYSEESFQYEMNIGKNYLEEDMNQTIILYSVDLEKTNLNSMYGESKKNGIIFKMPVELHVTYEIEKSELQSYEKTKNLGTYLKGGKLHIGVYQATLDEMDCDIKVGDYVGIQITPTHMEFWVVTDCGLNNYDNEHSVFGYKPAWRSIEAAPTTLEKEEFE